MRTISGLYSPCTLTCGGIWNFKIIEAPLAVGPSYTECEILPCIFQNHFWMIPLIDLRIQLYLLLKIQSRHIFHLWCQYSMHPWTLSMVLQHYRSILQFCWPKNYKCYESRFMTHKLWECTSVISSSTPVLSVLIAAWRSSASFLRLSGAVAGRLVIKLLICVCASPSCFFPSASSGGVL